jgi:hypothetical protein
VRARAVHHVRVRALLITGAGDGNPPRDMLRMRAAGRVVGVIERGCGGAEGCRRGLGGEECEACEGNS